MDLESEWGEIARAFEAGIRSSKHCAIASVDEDGHPHVTPIGFVFLREDRTAFYFEQYPKRLPRNLAHDARVCLMTVNSRSSFWGRSLARGRFLDYPGMRLYGEVGTPRAATPPELERLRRRIGLLRLFPGSKLIWSGLQTVRDVKLTRVDPVVYPRMMEHLLASVDRS